MDSLRHIRYVNLSSGVFSDSGSHLTAFMYQIGDENHAEYGQQSQCLKQREHHREKPALKPENTHVEFHHRLKNICHQTGHHERQQHSLEHVQKIEGAQYPDYSEYDSDHAVESVWRTIVHHKCV